jgi:hypothetical protein
MSRTRLAVVAATIACGLMLGAGPAAAQADSLTKVVSMTGTAENGKKFRGTFTIQRFATRNGQARAIGTLKGRLTGRDVTRRNVAVPVALGAAGATSSQLPPLPNSCTILNLTIQPITLNLLGLVVRTSRIDLRIDAVRGPGNLLGNLLCALTGILDPPALGGATGGQLASILNAILQFIPRTA